MRMALAEAEKAAARDECPWGLLWLRVLAELPGLPAGFLELQELQGLQGLQRLQGLQGLQGLAGWPRFRKCGGFRRDYRSYGSCG